ncbi:MAG: hypothetical protein DRI44_05755 [Chlamydiae bacterium]|nr:MAG: hypothetical protein DRI44_05755 [Chlamydiota bacterium]
MVSEDEKLTRGVRFLYDRVFGNKRRPLRVSHGKYIIKMWKLEWFTNWLYYYATGNKRKKYELLQQLYRKNARHYPPPNFHNPYRKIRYSLHRRLESEIKRFHKQKYYAFKKLKLKQFYKESGLGRYYKAMQKAGLKWQH